MIDQEPRLSQLLDKKIKSQLIFYFAIFLALVGMTVYHALSRHVPALYPVTGFVIGSLLGVFAARVFRISWDKSAGQVIARLDLIGVTVFILYILIEILQEKYLRQFVAGNIFVAITFSLFAGVMFGRLAGIRGKIRKVLEEQRMMRH